MTTERQGKPEKEEGGEGEEKAVSGEQAVLRILRRALEAQAFADYQEGDEVRHYVTIVMTGGEAAALEEWITSGTGPYK